MTRQNVEAGRHRASCCSLVMAIARGERPTVSEEDFATVLAAAGKTDAEFSADVERLITLGTDAKLRELSQQASIDQAVRTARAAARVLNSTRG